jgi:integrase
VIDAATKTGNQSVVRLDPRSIGRGHDLRTVSGRLGHANAAMTLRTYARAIDGADADVAATLAAALEDQPEDET